MGACNIVILFLRFSVLNIVLLPSFCESDVIFDNKVLYFDEITPEVVKETVTETAEGVVAFAGDVPASGTVSIVGQSFGYSQNNGFQQWIPPYPPIEAPYPYIEAPYPYIEAPYLPMEGPHPYMGRPYPLMETPYTPYTVIPSAYGPVQVPYTELIYPYMYPYVNWYPLYPVSTEYPGQSYPNFYMDDIVDNHHHKYSAPVSGRVRIEANFGSCGSYPYPYQAVSENDIVSPTINPDYYNNYPEPKVAPAIVVNAKGGVTIAANFER